MSVTSRSNETHAAKVYGEVVAEQGMKFARVETISLPMKQMFVTSAANDLLDFTDRQFSQTVFVGALTSASPAMPLDPRLKAWAKHFEHEFRALEGRDDRKAMFLEVWINRLPVRRIHLPVIRSVYNGGPFGTPQVSSKMAAFIAEPADPKYPTGWWRNDDPAPSLVEKFAFRPSFGEKLNDSVSPQLFVWNLELPGTKPKLIRAPDNYVFASPSIRPGGLNSIVVVGFKIDKRLSRPGFSVCFNRESSLFLIDDIFSEHPRIKNITESLYLALGPTWSADGKHLVFTGANTSFATHCTELNLFRIDADHLNDQSSVPIHDIKPRAETAADFPGLFLVVHEETRLFRILKDNKTLIFTSNCQGVNAVYKLNIFAGNLSRIGSPDSSYSLLETFADDILVLHQSSFKSPPQLVILKHEELISLNLNPAMDCLAGCSVSVVHSANASGFLLRAGGASSGGKAPLLVKIHGGPHACAMNAWSTEIACYLKLGFHVLLPNYRGSGGFGRDFLEALPGKCGEIDVRDCHELTVVALAQLGASVDTTKVFAYGASHGGYITAHLLGNPEFNKTFSAGVLWNPALDLVSSNLTSDIPEWSVCEVDGHDAVSSAFHPGHEFLQRAYNKSAMKFASGVTAPSLVVLGSADVRVNPMAGLRWAQYVEELGNAKTDVLWYPDQGHSISGPECSDHVIVSILAWMLDRAHH